MGFANPHECGVLWRMKFLRPAAMVLLLLGNATWAKASSEKTWADISDWSVGTLISSALIVPTAKGDWRGLGQAALSVGVANGVAQGFKAVIHERRPDRSDNKSFPSGHATLAFASATTLHRRYGWKVGLPAYAVATLTGVARHEANKHFWHDVGAGAALGIASGWVFTKQRNPTVRLTPWVTSKGAGLLASASW